MRLAGPGRYAKTSKSYSDPESVLPGHYITNGLLNLSNTLAERLNGKIQTLKTVAKGYRTFANYRSAVLFFRGGLDLYPH
jgi:hypothetical protein